MKYFKYANKELYVLESGIKELDNSAYCFISTYSINTKDKPVITYYLKGTVAELAYKDDLDNLIKSRYKSLNIFIGSDIYNLYKTNPILAKQFMVEAEYIKTNTEIQVGKRKYIRKNKENDKENSIETS